MSARVRVEMSASVGERVSMGVGVSVRVATHAVAPRFVAEPV